MTFPPRSISPHPSSVHLFRAGTPLLAPPAETTDGRGIREGVAVGADTGEVEAAQTGTMVDAGETGELNVLVLLEGLAALRDNDDDGRMAGTSLTVPLPERTERALLFLLSPAL